MVVLAIGGWMVMMAMILVVTTTIVMVVEGGGGGGGIGNRGIVVVVWWGHTPTQPTKGLLQKQDFVVPNLLIQALWRKTKVTCRKVSLLGLYLD